MWFFHDIWVTCMWILICYTLMTCVVWYHIPMILLHLCLLEAHLLLGACLMFWFWSLLASTIEFSLTWCLCHVLSFLVCVWHLIYPLSCLIAQTLVFILLYKFTWRLHTFMMNQICMTFRSKTCLYVYMNVMLLPILIW